MKLGNSGVNRFDLYGLMPQPWDGGGPAHVQVPEMTCKKAREIVATEIAKWRTEELSYNFAADLLQRFLDGGGDNYVPNESHINEVEKHGSPFICKEIGKSICPLGASRVPYGWYLKVVTDIEDDSNVRWGMSDDLHMTNSYSGARLSFEGHVTASPPWWEGRFAITLQDRYEFIKSGIRGSLKQLGSEILSPAYAAASFLEGKCGVKPFEHKMEFDVDCKGCCGVIYHGYE